MWAQVCSLVMAIILAMMVMVTCASAQVTTFEATNYITTIAGTGVAGYNGDDQLATYAKLNYPHGVTVNSLGEVLITEGVSNRIRKILLNGNITTIAGTGGGGYNGDGILATAAQLKYPFATTVNSLGEVLIADLSNNRIRKILLNGTITTIAGTGDRAYNGDGILATAAQLNNPYGVAVNTLGEVLIADTYNHRIRKILLNGTITTIAGTGVYGYNGDGILATNATLYYPAAVAMNSLSEVVIADLGNSRIRKILLNGTITTIAGIGVAGYNGDGILATAAQLNNPYGVAVNSLGEVVIADFNNNRIRKILLNGTITTIAGTGVYGYNGDGILSTSADITSPFGIAVNSLDEVLFADSNNHRIRKLSGVCPANSIQSGQQCNCLAGYFGYGQYCNKYNCSNIAHDRSDVCSSNGQCVSPNNCTCNAGYYGNNCEQFDCYGTPKTNTSGVCSGSGQCSAPNNCICNAGYFGSDCKLYNCNNILYNDARVCSSQGSCIGPNNCTCNTGYYGNNCDQFDCYGKPKTNTSSVCSGSGQCTAPNNCTCNAGYYGTNCEQFDCYGIPKTNTSGVCSGSGQCGGPNNCTCNSGWNGTYCEIPLCDGIQSGDSRVCNGRGSCDSKDICKCSQGWGSTFCNVPICNGTLATQTNTVCGGGHGYCSAPDVCICTNSYGGQFCTIPICNGILASNSSVCSNGNGVCSTVDTCVCNNGFVGNQCSLYYISSDTLSVSFSSTQDYILESSTAVRIVINNAQFTAFYNTRSVTVRLTFTLDSGSPVVVSVVQHLMQLFLDLKQLERFQCLFN